MSVHAAQSGSVSLVCVTRRCFARYRCRLFAPLALGLTLQLTSGCTVVGYAIGTGTTPAPEAIEPTNTRAIPKGSDVEVFYLREPCAGEASAAAPRTGPPCDIQVVNGAYQGVEGSELVLRISRLTTRSSLDGYGSGSETTEKIERLTLPLARVRLIRTKPSRAPALVGALVGAAIDLITLLAVDNIAHDVH